MEIEVQLLAYLNNYLPEGTKGYACKLQLDGPKTVADVLRKLGVPEDLQRVSIISVNGAHVGDDHALADGDTLSVVPLHTGG